MAIEVAIAGPKAKGKGGRKTVDHLEIHPKLGGGTTVKHVYSGFDHEPKEVNFGKEQGHQALAHIARHAGLPAGQGAQEPETAADAGEGEEQEEE